MPRSGLTAEQLNRLAGFRRDLAKALDDVIAEALASPTEQPVVIEDGIDGNVRIARLQLEPHVTTAQLPAGTTENYDPGVDAVSVVRVQTHNSGSSIGGIVPPSGSDKDGRVLMVINHGDGNGARGTSPLVLKHRSQGSDPVNRIVMPDLTDLELPYTGCALMAYEGDGVNNGSWYVWAVSNGGRYLRLTVGDLWLRGNYPDALAAGNNNNYEPPGWTDHVLHEVLVNAGAVLTGLKYIGTGTANSPYLNSVYRSGMVRIIANRSDTIPIKVLHDSELSTEENRIYSAAGDFEIAPCSCAMFVYDYQSAHWRVVGSPGAFGKLMTVSQELDTLADGNNNNWNPTNLSTVGHRKVQTGSNSVLTGIKAQRTGHIITLVAFGSFTVAHQSGQSTIADQIYLPQAYQAGGLTLNTGDSVTFRYDGALGNWMTIALAR